jgi:NAD(P)-dependent dehydrogenase (short-subunit alcohol dehydrogenase family)
LAGKISLVTGAGSGLGRIICEAMAEHGSDVVCSGINESWAQETADIITKCGILKLKTPPGAFGHLLSGRKLFPSNILLGGVTLVD